MLAASHYSWDTVARQMESIYRRLIQPGQALEATPEERHHP
jgi:sulfur transfer protein SufE